MSAGGETYEVLALRYGTRATSASEVFLNFATYGEPDRPMVMDYFFWVARNERRTVVIDTGFAPAAGAARGRTRVRSIEQALDDVSVDAHQGAQVVVSHAHYDHIGCLDHFPDAEVLMAQAEYDFWTDPVAEKALFAQSSERSEIDYLRQLRARGALSPFSGASTLAPGIELVEVGGHTPGQVVVRVQTSGGMIVLASDAVHYYEEVERDLPFTTVVDVAGMYRAYERLREMLGDPGVQMVAGHDPEVMTRFPERGSTDNVVVLARP
jgi:glyoxylase-like metal-dependent hydrolase (beta-lactamase superfamily II)